MERSEEGQKCGVGGWWWKKWTEAAWNQSRCLGGWAGRVGPAAWAAQAVTGSLSLEHPVGG
jgi:hypothetical protein